jgi:hypothetical protein
MAIAPVRVPIVALDKFTAPIRLFTMKINGLTRPIDDLQHHIGKAHRAVSGLFAALSKPVKFFGAPLGFAGKMLGRGLGALGTIPGMLGITGIGAATAGIWNIAKSTADFGESLAKTAYKLGVTIEELQLLRHAAKMSDVEIESFDTSLARFTKNMADPGKRGLFTALGIDPKKAKSTKEAFLSVADAVKKIQNAGLRTRVLSELFGREGLTGNIAGLFKGGRVELEKLMAEKRQFGLMSDDDIRKAEAFSDAWKRFGEVFIGIRNSVGIELLGPFQELIEKIQSVLPSIQPKIVSFVKNIASNVNAENLDKFGAAIKTFAENLKLLASAANIALTPLRLLAGIPWLFERTGDNGMATLSGGKTIEASPNIPGLPGGSGAPAYAKRAAAALQKVVSQNIVQTNQSQLDIKIWNADGLRTQAMLSGNPGNFVQLHPGMVTP